MTKKFKKWFNTCLAKHVPLVDEDFHKAIAWRAYQRGRKDEKDYRIEQCIKAAKKAQRVSGWVG